MCLEPLRSAKVGDLVSPHAQMQDTNGYYEQDGITDILNVQQYPEGNENAYKAPVPDCNTPHHTSHSHCRVINQNGKNRISDLHN